MPCWSIHLGICKEVNKKFNYNKDLILFGSILPDMLDKSYSHYYDNHIINFDDFFHFHSDNMDNPLMIGYYIHLLTDYYYNKYVSDNCWIYDDDGNTLGIKLFDGTSIINKDYKFCRNFKQDDFKNYGNYLITNNLLEYPKDGDLIYKNIKKLRFKINKKRVFKEIYYLGSEEFYSYYTFDGYKLFDKKTYDKLYSECINYIVDKINELFK